MSQHQKVDDERLRNRRCGIDNCPSKRYFRIDGRIVCDRGHEQVSPPSSALGHRVIMGVDEGRISWRRRRMMIFLLRP